MNQEQYQEFEKTIQSFQRSKGWKLVLDYLSEAVEDLRKTHNKNILELDISESKNQNILKMNALQIAEWEQFKGIPEKILAKEAPMYINHM